jgi:hypothetical protein
MGFGLVASLVFGAGGLGHEAGGLRPPLAWPAPMLRSMASPGSDDRHWSPDVILGFAKYALSFSIYIRLSFSLIFL